MKKILIVIASEVEVLPDFRQANNRFYPLSQYGLNASLLITGPGAVPTTFALLRVIDDFDAIVNAGIAGSFTTDLPLGSVVLVDTDSFADYGVDDNGMFKHIDSILPGSVDTLPLSNLVNPYTIKLIPNLPRVKGVTVSTVSGSTDRIAHLKSMWNAQIETMESAAVFYVCNKLGKPFFCFRSISNYVEPRNRKNWQLELAVKMLWQELIPFISNLNKIV